MTMTIKTSKGKSYTALWIDTPINDETRLLMAMQDGRRLSVIAKEFDGLERLERYDKNQGDKVYEGYTLLEAVNRMPDGKVQLAMRRAE